MLKIILLVDVAFVVLAACRTDHWPSIYRPVALKHRRQFCCSKMVDTSYDSHINAGNYITMTMKSAKILKPVCTAYNDLVDR